MKGDPLFEDFVLVQIKREYFAYIVTYISIVWISTIVLFVGTIRRSNLCVKVYNVVFAVQLVCLVIWNLSDFKRSNDEYDAKPILNAQYFIDIILSCILVFLVGDMRKEDPIDIPETKVALPTEDWIVYNDNKFCKSELCVK